ncbi:hypothetical protein MUN88_12230 [Gracilibacillus caseinilyticus]|uniref:Regulatory protein YrvL n=1 Tax=Gracilibacillus caseinilyticus TaxID=2932256 RepID=A0ABY4ER93_9BACI|nr:hypothetical protein [Gracilibacillus caseinilyticus]UOQ46860.1 hypothetical protein MUN88_12230 [Gracilibacillus caseinilyticus]
MIKRKLITVLLATPISLCFIFAIIFGEWKQPRELMVMTGTFSLWISPIILVYGVPVTFLSDYLCKRFTENLRTLFAFLIHIFFGILFGLLFPMGTTQFSLLGVEINFATLFASITAIFFWMIDEVIRRVIRSK